MTILVDSEIGRLRRVLVHRPGQEIDWMVPSMMERLLFDDILDGDQARCEHDNFCRVLQAGGVSILDPEQLLVAVMEKSDARQQVFETLQQDYGLSAEHCRPLADLSPAQLARTLIYGIRHEGYPLVGQERRFFEMDPLSNYFFQRDPQLVIGDRVILSAMATEAREREPFLSWLLFRHHPELAGYRDCFDMDEDWPTSWAPGREADFPYPELEGGDVLVVNRKVLMVGMSARTNVQGVELLAEYLRSQESSFEHIVLVQLPARRSYMHLDTVFTFIDHNTCLGFLPVVEPGRSQSARVYLVDLHAEQLAFAPRRSVRQALAELGVEIDIVPCGGSDDLVAQQREQWTDGANSFAIAPGVILLYRRNRRTLEELKRRGWRVLSDEEVLGGGIELLGQGPTVVSLHDNELSRARGGPHCMTMPLERDPVAG